MLTVDFPEHRICPCSHSMPRSDSEGRAINALEQLSLDDLYAKRAELSASDGQLPRGLRTFRRRLERVIAQKEGEQAYQYRMRETMSEWKRRQYEAGYVQGHSDKERSLKHRAGSRPDAPFAEKEPAWKQGYDDGYCEKARRMIP